MAKREEPWLEKDEIDGNTLWLVWHDGHRERFRPSKRSGLRQQSLV
jgi:hypothetical protein